MEAESKTLYDRERATCLEILEIKEAENRYNPEKSTNAKNL